MGFPLSLRCKETKQDMIENQRKKINCTIQQFSKLSGNVPPPPDGSYPHCSPRLQFDRISSSKTSDRGVWKRAYSALTIGLYRHQLEINAEEKGVFRVLGAKRPTTLDLE